MVVLVVVVVVVVWSIWWKRMLVWELKHWWWWRRVDQVDNLDNAMLVVMVVLGIVVVRYQIATTNTAKATGGNISFYNGKTIHTFILVEHLPQVTNFVSLLSML